MISEQQIRITAESMMRNHGTRADGECRMMALRCSKRGHPDGAEVWQRVMAALRAMQ